MYLFIPLSSLYQKRKNMKTQTTQTQMEFHVNALKEAKQNLDKARKEGASISEINTLEYNYANQLSWVSDLNGMSN